MFKYEDQNTEFKQEYVTDIKKEVLGFINSDGGTIYVGIRKDGEIIGMNDPDGTMLKIANSLKDTLVPDVMPFIKINSLTIENKIIIEIQVSTGTNRPYYLKEKGLKPSGVYIRKGTSTQPMSEEAIKEMIIQSNGRSFEDCRSIEQNLTFKTLTDKMNDRNLSLKKAQMITLKMIGEDDLYTNLAYLLSDQCNITTKIALFQGKDKEEFRDRKEFKGSLLKQLDDVYEYLLLSNKTKAHFIGLNRYDKEDYPKEALREALLNSVVHRDYSFSGSNIINIYEDRIEFISLGGLVPGLELDSIFLGVSQSRNPHLASLFYRMHLIESYGTGISKIQRSYKNELQQPLFETAKGVFRVTLPNQNEEISSSTSYMIKESPSLSSTYNDSKQLILNYTRTNQSITRKEIETLLHVGTTKACKLLKELCESNLLLAQGNGRNKYYTLK